MRAAGPGLIATQERKGLDTEQAQGHLCLLLHPASPDTASEVPPGEALPAAPLRFATQAGQVANRLVGTVP